MVVTRKTPVAPVPTGSRTNSSQALPRVAATPKTKSALADPPKDPDANANKNAIASPKPVVKSRHKNRHKKPAQPRRSPLDLLVYLFLFLFGAYAFTTCPGDAVLTNPVCRGLSQYRTHILEPYVLPPLQRALSHPAVAPYTAAAESAVKRATPYAAAAQRAVVHTTKYVVPAYKRHVVPRWRAHVVPLYRKHVLPLWRKHVLPYYTKHAAPLLARAQPYARAAQHSLERTAFALHKAYSQHLAPFARRSYALTKPYVVRAYVWFRPRAIALYKKAGSELGSARRAYVDPHVERIWDKVLELSGKEPVAPSPTTGKEKEEGTSGTAVMGTTSTPTQVVKEAAVTPVEPAPTPADSATPTPEEAVPEPSEASSSSSSTPSSSSSSSAPAADSAAPTSAASAASVAAQSAHGMESVVVQEILSATSSSADSASASSPSSASPSASPSATPSSPSSSASTPSSTPSSASTAPEMTPVEPEPEMKPEVKVDVEEVEAAASIAAQSAHGMESAVVEAILADAAGTAYEAAPASTESTPSPADAAETGTEPAPVAAAAPEPEEEPTLPSLEDPSDDDDDTIDFLADLGLDTAEPVPVVNDDDEEDVALTPEEEAALAARAYEEKLRKTAEKRADLESRMSTSNARLKKLAEEKRKELRKALVRARKAGVARLDGAGVKEVGEVEKEGEKMLKGLEGYLRKETKGASGKEGKGEEKMERWERVVRKVEEKLGERIQAAQGWLQGVHVQEKEGEVNEGMALIQQVKDACSQAQGDVGLDLSWLDDVTYMDWQVYHDLARIGEAFQAEASEIQAGTHAHPPVDPSSRACSSCRRSSLRWWTRLWQGSQG
ncbi:hypothetical protein FB451DRAFT_1555243 [Mycena latifolia]|nr:hypothetical protein FB451DRAFT_1555243 [Mycena latifolia]